MTPFLRGFVVCVEYADLLALTLPRNRRWFAELTVVTAPADDATAALALDHGCRVHVTDAFTRGGALFNKWLALEEALDEAGRHDWICLLDADVVWPARGPERLADVVRPGVLYSPLRRMQEAVGAGPLPEHQWPLLPIHRNVAEWAGYTQIFHGTDPHLPQPPWHQTDWRHAGGADSFFQARWPREAKARLPWDVLHLGPAGENWCGRASPLVGGGEPDGAADRRAAMARIWAGRRGKTGDGRFSGEKL